MPADGHIHRVVVVTKDELSDISGPAAPATPTLGSCTALFDWFITSRQCDP